MERMKHPGEEKNMYSIEFYEKENGESDVWDFLEELREKAVTNKDARIQYRQITLYIELLQNNGTRQPDNITKHIEENIWELRPGNNRVFYFYYENDTFVLLHHFRKKRRRRRREKLNRRKQNAMIIYAERRL